MSSPVDAGGDDAQTIRELIGTRFDKPKLPVETDPVVVEGDHAVAGWTQGERGGRALLRRDAGEWKLILCGGDGLKSPEGLASVGVPGANAAALASKLAAAEAELPSDRLARFATFEGTVQMDAPNHSH